MEILFTKIFKIYYLLFISIIEDASEIMFLGDFRNEKPPETLIDAFQDLIQFGMDLGKIDLDYTLYGDCQVRETDTPGSALISFFQEPPFSEHFNSSGLIIESDDALFCAREI